MSDIAFANNYTNLFFLNVAPPGATKDYARIGAGINKVDWNGNEVVSQDDYYDGDGMSETEVTGGQLVGTFSGHRRYGDRAQDWIARNTINNTKCADVKKSIEAAMKRVDLLERK